MIKQQVHTNHIILIPAYQPGEALAATTNQLIAANFIVVVVDDGSGSGYDHIFTSLHKNVQVIKHDINKGKGAALKTGYRYIKKTFREYVVITADADGQHHVDDIKKMSKAYSLHPGTVLLGIRTFEDNNVPFRSRFGNIVTRKIFSLITKRQLQDTQTGLRAFDEGLVDFMITVPGERFEYEINVLLACGSKGVEIVELPILTIYENNNESSHFDPIKDSWSIYKQFIKFTSSSLLAFGIDYSLFIILLQLAGSWGLAGSVLFANVLARTISAIFNFTVNKNLIFKHKGNLAKDTLQYVMLVIIILIGNTIVLNILISGLHIIPYIAKIITEITFFFISYIVQKKMIFINKGEH